MAAEKSITFSPREMEVLALAWQCMDTQPKVRPSSPRLPSSAHTLLTSRKKKINMDKLARLTGYTPGSASVTFGNIKRKIKLLGEALAEDGPRTPKKGGRGKSVGVTPKKHGKNVDADATPSKRARKAAAVEDDNDNAGDDDDDDEDFELDRSEVKDEIKSEDKVRVKEEGTEYAGLTLDEELQQVEMGYSKGLLDGIGEFGA
jgi:hypothetical protein